MQWKEARRRYLFCEARARPSWRRNITINKEARVGMGVKMIGMSQHTRHVPGGPPTQWLSSFPAFLQSTRIVRDLAYIPGSMEGVKWQWWLGINEKCGEPKNEVQYTNTSILRTLIR